MEFVSLFTADDPTLNYVATHVFFPMHVPEGSDYTIQNDLALARAVCTAAHAYTSHINNTLMSQWHTIAKMLDNLLDSVRSGQLSRDVVVSQLGSMQPGDILAFLVRPQRAAVIFRKQENCTLCEPLEVSPDHKSVESTGRSIVYSYPGTVICVHREVFDDVHFQTELANFISLPGKADSDPPSVPPGHSEYITALLPGILRSVGDVIEGPHIVKRIRDEVGLRGTGDEWRRSSLWLLIRVAIQTSLDRSPLGRVSYKAFTLFLMCNLAIDARNASLPSDLLYLMSAKVARRLSKLGSSASDGLSDMALQTCTCLQDTLDVRAMEIHVSSSPPPHWDPSELDLSGDTQYSLPRIGQYIRSSLASPSRSPPPTHIWSRDFRRGTLGDFLSSDVTFFDEAYSTDPFVTLYDVEQSIEQGIDHWVACVRDVDEACAHLATLMDAYLSRASASYGYNSECCSIMKLTAIELWVALDKLVVGEIPMLAEYSPEIPISLLESLQLDGTANLLHLSRSYQYLFARHSRSRIGFSVLSDEFTEDSFPVRYYNSSPDLQDLKARMETETLGRTAPNGGLAGWRRTSWALTLRHKQSQFSDQYDPHQQLDVGAETAELLLPISPLQSTVIAFELQCPLPVCIWRSIIVNLLHRFCPGTLDMKTTNHDLISDVPELRPYLGENARHESPIYCRLQLAYLHPDTPQSCNNPTLGYAFKQVETGTGFLSRPEVIYHVSRHGACTEGSDWDHNTGRPQTPQTSNTVLAYQLSCPPDSSLDEFIALEHLRCCGRSLQWLDILRELRGRILDFHSHQAYSLLSQQNSGVGPLDVSTGKWVWHEELHDPVFCTVLLDELENLFLDVSNGSLDGVAMRTISLLLTRILAFGPPEGVSERAYQLLRNVRSKTLKWVQDLAYNLMKAPTNEERRRSLSDMATACRSTFDVRDNSTLRKLLQSAEDVEAVLACAFFIRATSKVHDGTSDIRDNLGMVDERERRLCVAIEGVLKDLVQANPSDRGVDLAVCDIWPGYQPGPRRWEQEQNPNSPWVVSATAATTVRQSQVVRINLMDGSLLVDGRPLGQLPQEIQEHPLYEQIFHGQALLVVPSSLLGMEFATLAVIYDHHVHFSLRDDNLVIRAQHRETNDVLEIVPPEKLQGDLPTFFVQDHVHWLNLSTSTIEIRPLKNIWAQSRENWEITGTHGKYHVHGDHKSLVDMQSQTWAMVSSLLECLDLSENLVVTTSTVDSSPTPRLSVVLPRHNLSFFVNSDGNLESDDFKEMIYDENQCIGTLFGLVSQLVLRAKVEVEEGLVPKCVLVPLDPSFREEISGSTTYHFYKVDTELGCLTGSSTLGGKEFLVYLHAKTSIDWRPDPLTGRTGAQEALSILQSAGYQSLLQISDYPYQYYLQEISLLYPQIITSQRRAQTVSTREFSSRDVFLQPTRSAARARYLFPQDLATRISQGEYNDIQHTTSFPDLQLEDTAYTAAFLVYHRLVDAPTSTNTISNWVGIWEDAMSVDTTHSSSPYNGMLWNPNLPRVVSAMVHDILQEHNGTRQQFQLLFLLPTFAYCSSHPQTAFISMLLAFAKGEYYLVNYAEYKLLDGYSPTKEMLWDHIYNASGSRSRRWNVVKQDRARKNVDRMLEAWPSDRVPMLDFTPGLTHTLQELFSSCYRNLKLLEDLTHFFQEGQPVPGPRAVPQFHCVFGESSGPSPRISQTAHIQTLSSSHYHASTSLSSLQHIHERLSWQITPDRLLLKREAPMLPSLTKLPSCTFDEGRHTPSNIPVFNRLLSSLRLNEGDPSFQEQYVTHLHSSARHVRGEYQMIYGTMGMYPIDKLKKHFVECKRKWIEALCILKESLGPTSDPLERALAQCGQWPQITTYSLLQCLASTSPIQLSETWKKCLVSFALLLLEFQRSRRLLRFAWEGLEEEFTKELENKGCDGWNAGQYPDWLLIQLEGNFLIRSTQANIAMEMISPHSGENTVMQVNMGDGKSSVIVPITAATVADGHQLVRVIAPKALTVQMFHLLVDRFGGLADRPIYRLSFSRSDHSNGGEIKSLSWKMFKCMEERGILLVQPEDVLSLKLKGVEEQIPVCKHATRTSSMLQKLIHEYDVASVLKYLHDSYLAKVFRELPGPLKYWITEKGTVSMWEDDTLTFLELQKWLHSHTRDILDESDEILHPRRQLIYTLGHQQRMEGYPDRWIIIQQILGLVKWHASSLSQDLPDSVEYASRQPGSFPHLHILRTSDAGRRLILLLVEDVMAGHLPPFRFRFIGQTQRDAIRSFMLSENVGPDRARETEDYAKRSLQNNLWNGLLLLRGLFASNILLFALTERRWRVDYGLDFREAQEERYPLLIRSSLAVPYRAKDVPAPDTQFGHPDITILLTCLSYYYTGLCEAQLRTSFQMLLKENNPATEYALWVRDCGSASLPISLRNLKEFNLDASEQWDDYLFPIFAYNQATIDFYLSRIVFPREAKEYPWKLAASSWDLAEKREHPITGFSGTNDGRYLLPVSITQRELGHQQGANARVLAYLLQPENDSYMLITRENGKPTKTLEFLKMVVGQQPEICVLLDVGAQILDISNRDLARAWLNLTNKVGAIYFDENDTPMAFTRNGNTQPLMASSLAQQLDRCVIYLDDAHTRGTDLKLPAGFRAAVTLGPKVTKDRLVQGCMRMRKLGHGHSVMFFAPLEVDQSIRSVTHREDRTIRITTADVLKWAIHETWTDIRQRAPQWAQQGMSYKKRSDAWSHFCNNEITPEQLADAWLQPELKTLADLYAPCETTSTSGPASSALETDIGRRCEDLGVAKPSIHSTQLDEQLERQVNREIEREREVELPPTALPATHSLHPDVVTFVKTGALRTSNAFRPVFTSLENSSADTRRAHVWSPFLLATADFCETVEQVPTDGRADQYLRPVQWVLSGRKNDDRILVLLSPFEADLLIPDIRVSKYVHLHVYVPRISDRMQPTDDLMFYTIPPVPDNWTPPWDLIDQLNVFAGQLYLRDWDSYLRLTHFLGIHKPPREDKMEKISRYNLFNVGSFKKFENTHTDSLLPSVIMLLAIRRRGLPFADTHMGRILQGQSLTEEDFACPVLAAASV